MVVGLLALQGDFARHHEKIAELGVKSVEVRSHDELSRIDGLIIPGGESTTMTKLIDHEFRDSLNRLSQRKPVWGTCAGMIMLSKTSDDPRVRPFGWMDFEVDRNGYGRQVHSFEAELRVSTELGDEETPLHGVFIRAPRLRSIGTRVHTLVWLDDKPVCVQQGKLIASSFHPELTDDLRLHRYFLSLIGTAAE